MKYYVLYNPFSGDGKNEDKVKLLNFVYESDEVIILDITKISNYQNFFSGLESDASVVAAGGDGTLCRFINATINIEIKNNLLYYPIGNGNDFARDVNMNDTLVPFKINEYINNLPKVEVNNKKYYFINGVGYGIDGYCCEVGDMLRENKKKVNYTLIAIKGLLFNYKSKNAAAIIDKKEYKFKNVWIAPTMKGKYYGGGMMPTPNQNRLNNENKVSLMVFHCKSKLKALMIFPSIFTGKHIKKRKICYCY